MIVSGKIKQEISERGPIPFSRYMEMCLYDPEAGYYSRNAEQFGKAGDFYTSSDVHAVYGRLLARQFDEMWRALDRPTEIAVLELGPGRGLFAQDVLDWSAKKFPEFSECLRYVMVESSPALRRRLEERFASQMAANKVEIFESTPSMQENTIVFANEYFDALPVEIISSEGQLYVDFKHDRFTDIFLPAQPECLEYLDRYSVHPESGERVEACLAASSAMDQICSAIRRGFLTVVDYGYTRSEQFEGRHRGTLMTYRQHSASPDPYEAPGEQDITAHVNFTALADVAEKHGLQVEPLLTQSQFLVGIGETTQFADAFEDCRMPQERAKVALQLKHLVTPSGMGETFHVLVCCKNVERSRVADLAGLGFIKSRI